MTTPSKETSAQPVKVTCPGCFDEHEWDANVCPICKYRPNADRSMTLLAVGTQLKRYVIGEKLGQGGFGITYRGFDLQLRIKVAIKEYYPSELVGRSTDRKTVVLNEPSHKDLFDYGLNAFLQEVRTLAQVNHQHLVRVWNCFEMHQTAYLVMSYYEGEVLATYLKQQPNKRLPWRRAVDLMLPVLDGLEKVHQAGFMHRDIKPSNLYLTRVDELILLDFGAARDMAGSHTHSREIFSEGYAPYEQCVQSKLKQQGPWTDVYGAAATLYFMLTAERPPSGLTRQQGVRSKQLDPLKRARSLVPTVPFLLDTVLNQALMVEPEQRLQSIGEFKRRLEEVLEKENKVEKEREKAKEKPRFEDLKWPTKLNLRAAVIVLSLVVLVCVIIWWVVDSGKTEQKLLPVIAPVSVPVPVPGALEINTEPQGAMIWVDGIPLGPTPQTVRREGEATVEVKVVLEGYKPREESFSLKPGEHRPVTLWLERVRKSGDVLERDRLTVDNSEGPALVFIEAGCFSMGSPETEAGRYNDERQHQVCLKDDFVIGQYEVTVKEFRGFVEATGYRTEAERNVDTKGCRVWSTADNEWAWREGLNWREPGYGQEENHPVVCVSWNDANAYVEWLSQQTGQRYRLPTEAEWEYTARGGVETARYWGNDADQACSYANVADQTQGPNGHTRNVKHACTDGYWYPAPVGRFQPNVWKLYDMLGNVWEWTCSDYAKDYDGAELECVNSDTSGPLAVRGGSWNVDPAWVRSAFRFGDGPTDRFSSVGFRLARSL